MSPLALSYLSTLGTSSRSVVTMRDSLRRVSRVLGLPNEAAVPWINLSHDNIQVIRAKLGKPKSEGGLYSPSTANHTLVAIRQVLIKAADLEMVTEEWLAKRLRWLKPIRGKPRTAGRALSNQEIAALLAEADRTQSPKGPLLRAILLVALGTGLRRAELAAIELKHVGDDRVLVFGKGNKPVDAVLDKTTRAAIRDWLAVRRGLRWKHQALFGHRLGGTR